MVLLGSARPHKDGDVEACEPPLERMECGSSCQYEQLLGARRTRETDDV